MVNRMPLILIPGYIYVLYLSIIDKSEINVVYPMELNINDRYELHHQGHLTVDS